MSGDSVAEALILEGSRARSRGDGGVRAGNLSSCSALLRDVRTRLVAIRAISGVGVAGRERPIVIPSLFRHFAEDHQDLELIWATMRANVDAPDFSEGASVIVRRARTIASSLPFRVRRAEDPESRRIAMRFTQTIAAMIVVGRLIELAIAASPPS